MHPNIVGVYKNAPERSRCLMPATIVYCSPRNMCRQSNNGRQSDNLFETLLFTCIDCSSIGCTKLFSTLSFLCVLFLHLLSIWWHDKWVFVRAGYKKWKWKQSYVAFAIASVCSTVFQNYREITFTSTNYSVDPGPQFIIWNQSTDPSRFNASKDYSNSENSQVLKNSNEKLENV